jgi:hypothetical protein
MTLLGIICRLAKQSQRLLRFTTGSSTNWGRFLVQWDIGLKSTKLHLQRARNEVIWKSKTTYTLIMDYTMTHVRFGCSHLHPMVQLTNTRRSDGAPDPDAAFKEVVRIQIRHYRNLYLNHPDPIAFIPLAVDTTGRMYDEFIRLLFLHAHRETSALANELPEESDQFRFLHGSWFTNLKGAVGLIMVKTSVMRISIPFDLSSRSCVPLPRFIRSRRPTPLLAPSLVFFPPCSA